jgi:RNA polymerase sigma factor (sigma-70 family)
MIDVGEKQIDAWMEALSTGDRAVFDPLFRQLYPRAFLVARQRLREPEAHDAAQTAMMKIFARADEFEAGRPALPWFYATLSNELRTAVRRDRRSSVRLAAYRHVEPFVRDAVPDPEALLVETELGKALEDAIRRLDAASAEAICALLGRSPPPTVSDAALRKRVSRAYVRLRTLLGGRP